MSVQVTGRYPVINRRRTGLFSLDMAVSNRSQIGYPMRTATEIYGYVNSGKSTLAYYLASILATKGKVVICDLEMLDRDYIKKMFETARFEGEIKLVDSTDDKGKPISHEQMLGDMVNTLYESGTVAGIWDAISAVTPIAEVAGEFGEANWGKAAKLNNQVARSLSSVMRNKEDESVFFGVNHIRGVMGGRGHTTPGGDAFKEVSAVRIMLWTKEVWKETSEPDSHPIGFLVEGQIEKLRFGGRGRKFNFYIVPGYGVHIGASAMFDCLELGLAESKTTVKMDGKSLGYIRKDLLQYAAQGKTRKFTPFLEKLLDYEKSLIKEMRDGDSKKDE